MKKSPNPVRSMIWMVALFGSIIFGNAQSKNDHQRYKLSKLYSNTPQIKNAKDNLQERINYEFERTKDPKSNTIPDGIRKAEISFSNKIEKGNDSKQSLARSAKSSKSRDYSYWKNRGPYNVGGRTRALAIDITNENIILAGGVSGGLWRSTNSGKSWRKVTNKRQTPSITCIVQDPRPGKHHIWYYGTGELLGNSASNGRGATFDGSGIFKSIDGGRTWRLLEATNDKNINSVSPFDRINSLGINSTNGDLIVGTFNGVFRSQDQGNSFEEVLAGGPQHTTEVAVTSTGRIYATINSNGTPNNGIYTSTTGNKEDWTKISLESYPNVSRTVIGIDPTNEKLVYFLAVNSIGFQRNFLFKYNANAKVAEERWTDLTANLPTNISEVGNLNLLRGYSMMIKISPTDSNLIFIGGTNLYRSTNGCTTPIGKEGWIGGYSQLGDFNYYPNHHPDQHALVFYPSNPNKVLSGSDGGVAVTEDITTTLSESEPVDWVSLNNGYLTTQPYHVSFDPSTITDNLLAGFQDNGTWFTSSINPKNKWIERFGSDGGYSAIADQGKVQYASYQLGNIFRFNVSATGEEESYTKITPRKNSGFNFIAPFILDPNNDNIMYLASRDGIWRNNNLDEIPLFSDNDTDVNWVKLSNIKIPERNTVSALDISTYPIANRLYYGTNRGKIYRMDNAIIDNQKAIDLSINKGFPEGFVNDINVDPSNDSRVIVTFSNYNVISLFLTEDAGETWTNISGNLEENVDGTGNGPSVRSTAFFGGSQGYFGSLFQKVYAATSTGLYYTYGLRGKNTYWYKEVFKIGNAVTDEVITRKDGFIAVAAHGNGLFSAKFPVFNKVPQPLLRVTYELKDIASKKKEKRKINIKDLFVHSKGDPIDLKIINSNPALVTASIENDALILLWDATKTGNVTIGLIATSGKEQVTEGLTITITEPGIYDQLGADIGSVMSEKVTDLNYFIHAADDFTIPEGTTWTVERILAYGKSDSSKLINATAVIYSDSNGKPGKEIYNSEKIAVISESTNPNLNIELPEAQILLSGTYWISVYTVMDFLPEINTWSWMAQSQSIGNASHIKDEENSFGTGAIDWTPASMVFGGDPSDQIFQIYGTINDTPEQPLTALKTIENSVTVFPNPSSDQFTFGLKNTILKENVSIKIYNVSGDEVFSNSNIKITSGLTWDASKMASGFYLVKISDKKREHVFKILKQ